MCIPAWALSQVPRRKTDDSEGDTDMMTPNLKPQASNSLPSAVICTVTNRLR